MNKENHKILAKQLAIASELKAPKNQENEYGGFRYRSCEDILEALKPLLKKNNAVLTISDEIAVFGEAEAQRFYVKAILTLVCTETGEKITTSAFAREAKVRKGMDEAQITGASSSYARKYALNGMFSIDDTKDVDTMDNRTSTEVEELKKKASKIKDVKELRKFYAKNRGLGKEFDEHIVSLAKELKEEKSVEKVEEEEPIKEKENES